MAPSYGALVVMNRASDAIYRNSLGDSLLDTNSCKNIDLAFKLDSATLRYSSGPDLKRSEKRIPLSIVLSPI